MKIVQILLMPFAFIYSLGVKWWRWMYKKDYWGKVRFSVPVISVGNLQAGGTGKTPVVDYLCGELSVNHHVAVLSRGYKRLTYGFRIVREQDSYREAGDESLWLKRRHPQATIAVVENRIEGIPYLMSHAPQTEVIILDDGFQQLGIRIDLNILVTPFHQPYTKDYMLPAGRLREHTGEAERADVIIVSKCPLPYLHRKEQVLNLLGIQLLPHQKAFLSSVYYAQPYRIFYEGDTISLERDHNIILVTGIGDASVLYDYVNGKVRQVRHLSFPDHYRYRNTDLEQIEKEFQKLKNQGKTTILTTEKDAMRLCLFRKEITEMNLDIYIQPISVKWDDEKEFNIAIKGILKCDV